MCEEPSARMVRVRAWLLASEDPGEDRRLSEATVRADRLPEREK
jgi:hypothetical protein